MWVIPSSDAVIAIELASIEGNQQFRIFWVEQCCWVLLLIWVGAEKMKKHIFFPFLNFFLGQSFKCFDSYQLFFLGQLSHVYTWWYFQYIPSVSEMGLRGNISSDTTTEKFVDDCPQTVILGFISGKIEKGFLCLVSITKSYKRMNRFLIAYWWVWLNSSN